MTAGLSRDEDVDRIAATIKLSIGGFQLVAVAISGTKLPDRQFGSSAIGRGAKTLGGRSFLVSSSQADDYSSPAPSAGSSEASIFESRFMLVA
jgi:hypothetical protein